ncbi:unnamed protein product [Adineta steineri]|uniref:NYN domain-containing protein n=1 Tax=Adineta steineri TaxID=433720 RepID=A0A815JXV6_9BILA|nr:unnamed protein product [Adineta steineri]CAF3764820.1 unnamed protein product [Adineta steineri]
MSSIIHDNSNNPRSDTSKSNIHIVVDNSNLFISAQLGQGKNGEQDPSIRVKVADVVAVIEENTKVDNIKTRIVGGSIPIPNERVWAEWKKCQYECLLGERSISNKEVSLDDMLHSKIQNLILKNKSRSKNGKQHLILVTGDGNANGNRTSFPDIVSLALKYQWTVDLWSWKDSLSGKFDDIQEEHSSNMKINHLDTYRTKITFKQKQKQKQEQQDQEKQKQEQEKEQEQDQQDQQDQHDQQDQDQAQQDQEQEQQNQQEQDQKIKKKKKKNKINKNNKIKINNSNKNNKMIYIYILWLILPLVILICSVIFIVFFKED